MITIPVGVLVSSVIIALSNPMIRETISTNGEATYQFVLSFWLIFHNLIPLVIICGAIALGLYFIPKKMIKGFNLFGKAMDTALRIVLVLCVVGYFTGIFSKIFGTWGFEPIIADEIDIYIGLWRFPVI